MRYKLWCALLTISSLTAILIILEINASTFSNVPTKVHSAHNQENLIIAEPNKERTVENLPTMYFPVDQSTKKKLPQNVNKSCAIFPDLFKIKFRNDHWQTQTTSNGTFQLLNAFMDDRDLNPNGKTVRILGLFDWVDLNITTYCQFWYSSKKSPVIVKSSEVFSLWLKGWGGDKRGYYQPYLISCNLPKNNQEIPDGVSLVEKPCDNATNNLRVIYDKPKTKKDFMVCVKGLNFPDEDLTYRLLEWIELLRLLGSDKVVFYEFSVHPNVKKLLNYYVDRDIIEVIPLTIADEVSNNPTLRQLFFKADQSRRRLQEVMPYNDCFYRNFLKYRYVVILDIDEVIVPVEGTWKELIKPMEKKYPNGGTSAFDARNIYFLDSHLHDHGWFNAIPKYLHMLQHVYRASNYTKPGYFVKCFHRTDIVKGVHNHYPRGCITKKCTHHEIDIKLGHLQHYRADCVHEVGNCDEMKSDEVMDTRVWNFKDRLIERCAHVLDQLKYLN